MPFRESTRMSQRRELVEQMQMEGGPPVSELCRRFGVSRKTAYKWLKRARAAQQQGTSGWEVDRSRKPARSPLRSKRSVEKKVLAVRREHQVWGGRKIRRRLVNLGLREVPSASTITAILRREDKLSRQLPGRREAVGRFEKELPNELWQMDFKGHFPVGIAGARCHPLVVVDDSSRFCLMVRGLPDEREEGIRRALVDTFRAYGLPLAMLMDNGPAWGGRVHGSVTCLEVWLMRHYVRVIHGRPFHPQTQGKCERFNRTLKAEALPPGIRFGSLRECQRILDRFRQSYNHERPHEALGLEVPARRYHPSPQAFPERLPKIEYLDGDLIRIVTKAGSISVGSSFHILGRALAGEPVALRPTVKDGVYDVFYCHTRVKQIELRQPDFVKYTAKKPRKL